MSDGSTLGISVSHVDGVDVVTIEGEVDLTNAEGLRAAVAETTARVVVLDFSAVTYLDSSGIRELDNGHRSLTAAARRLLIVTPEESAADWTLRVAGFDRALVLPSVDDAVAEAGVRFGR